MIDAVATVNLAHPNGGPPLPYGVPVLVDPDDEFTKAHLDAGFLVPVKKQPAGVSQTWDENAPAILTGAASDLGGVTAPETTASRRQQKGGAGDDKGE